MLIAIGMRFDDRVTGRLDKYARQAKVIHLDIDPAEIDKNVKSTVPVWGDCKETIPMLDCFDRQRSSTPEWHNKFKDYTRQEVEQVIHNELNPTTAEMTMGEVIKQLKRDHQRRGRIIVTDVGQHQMVACRYAQFNNTRSNVTSGGLGTMGFALPAAIGAKFGAQDRTVVAIIGDGGFQMTCQELGTIMQSGIDVKIIILKQPFPGYGKRQWQELFNSRRYSFVDIQSPDFVALAAAYRIPGKVIDDRKDLPSALNEMLSNPGSFLLESNGNQREQRIPDGTTRLQCKRDQVKIIPQQDYTTWKIRITRSRNLT